MASAFSSSVSGAKQFDDVLKSLAVWVAEGDAVLGFCAFRCSMPGPRIGMSRAGRAPCQGHKQVGRRHADRRGAVVTSALAA